MAQELCGNLSGLASAEKRSLERLFRRRIDERELVGLDLARELCALAQGIQRRIGVLISREGAVEQVAIGTRDIIYLPDLGRYRLGQGRLRRLRLIYTDLSKGEEVKIAHDVYADLEKLRLDSVVALKTQGKDRVRARYAYIVPNPQSVQAGTATEEIKDLANFDLDYLDFIEGLESELEARLETLHRPGVTGAVLVGVYEKSLEAASSSMQELQELARTAGVHILDCIIQRRAVDPKTLLGKGKLEEVVLRCLRLGAELLIIDAELRPAQWRAITNSTELKVIDRSMLILDIFAQRASSSEGRFQVELAQLKYNLPRLVEKDAGLSRLSGGIGGRGPGETKLEIGRRRIRDRISDLEKRIEKLAEERSLRRAQRLERGVPLVSLLGYTNVGKSSLFNKLTRSEVLVENKLFATLDPSQRRLALPQETAEGVRTTSMVVLSDTVGFIRDLPAELKTAFRATLDELHQAQLLLHVLDASDPEIEFRKRAVDGILQEMGVGNKPCLVLLNKSDTIPEEQRLALEREYSGIATSAKSGLGLERVLAAIREQLGRPASPEEFSRLVGKIEAQHG